MQYIIHKYGKQLRYLKTPIIILLQANICLALPPILLAILLFYLIKFSIFLVLEIKNSTSSYQAFVLILSIYLGCLRVDERA